MAGDSGPSDSSSRRGRRAARGPASGDSWPDGAGEEDAWPADEPGEEQNSSGGLGGRRLGGAPGGGLGGARLGRGGRGRPGGEPPADEAGPGRTFGRDRGHGIRSNGPSTSSFDQFLDRSAGGQPAQGGQPGQPRPGSRPAPLRGTSHPGLPQRATQSGSIPVSPYRDAPADGAPSGGFETRLPTDEARRDGRRGPTSSGRSGRAAGAGTPAQGFDLLGQPDDDSGPFPVPTRSTNPPGPSRPGSSTGSGPVVRGRRDEEPGDERTATGGRGLFGRGRRAPEPDPFPAGPAGGLLGRTPDEPFDEPSGKSRRGAPGRGRRDPEPSTGGGLFGRGGPDTGPSGRGRRGPGPSGPPTGGGLLGGGGAPDPSDLDDSTHTGPQGRGRSRGNPFLDTPADEKGRGASGRGRPAPAGPPADGGLLGGGNSPFPGAPGAPGSADEGRRGMFGRGRRGPEPAGPPTGGGLLGGAGDPFPGAADENRRGRRGPEPSGPPTGGGLLGPADESRRGMFGRGRRGPEPSGPPTGGGLLGGNDSPFPEAPGPATGGQARMTDAGGSGPGRRPGAGDRPGGDAFPDPSAPAEEGRRPGRSRRTADPSGPPTGSRGLLGRGRAEVEPDPFPAPLASNAVGESRRRDSDPSGPATGGRGLFGPVPDDDRDDDPFTPAEGSRGLLDAADEGRRPGRSRRREPDPFPMAGPAQDELTHPVRPRRGDRPERGDRSMDRSIENDPTGHEAARAALRNMDHPPLPDATIVAVAAKDHGRAGRNLPAAIGVGVALGVLALTSLFVRPEAFVALASFVVVLSVWELSGALAAKQIVVPVIPVAVGALGMLVSAYVAGPEGLLVSYMLTAFGILLWRIVEGLDGAMRDVTAGLFVAAYVPLLTGFAILMLAADQGPQRVVTFILVTIASDIGGYIAGVLFGKHPMAPRISPKKSWEGFAGSMVACLIAGTACVVFLLNGSPWVGAVIGIAAVFTATGGDLSESLLKRDLGIKDMGNLLPGHGGIMDRMDSLLPSAPVVYLLLFFLL
ncbi:phosphatidate cytidylyltransferase [Kineosporia sp. NBRC 101731]|uniref:phosphatidate cytidylyltransferase n=1 Tax=Kineosporia sp. NBRC 101731 TaxID=3032199 RepID=UPI0024A22AD5|nr:phosphatidate cytidylyltransferase [Kineosporia sp. NBRC 101731]GLY30193.1 hypothetical protein Kisp02_35580 [Kineosporia sp. NBRC 101731]